MTYNEIKKTFEEKNAWGLLTSIDISNCNPAFIRDDNYIKNYVNKLCELIEMKRFGETIVIHFGEDEKVAGYSMMQLIETSLISAHFCNNNNSIYIDVFSCKLYDPNVVASFTKNFFDGDKYNINIIFRGV